MLLGGRAGVRQPAQRRGGRGGRGGRGRGSQDTRIESVPRRCTQCLGLSHLAVVDEESQGRGGDVMRLWDDHGGPQPRPLCTRARAAESKRAAVAGATYCCWLIPPRGCSQYSTPKQSGQQVLLL